MIDNPLDKKAPFLRRLAALRAERSSWIPHWVDISEQVLPRRGRFLASDRNKGTPRNDKIIDNTAILALRTLASGLMSGVTSPARPWFRLGIADPAQAEVSGVKAWLSEVERVMRDVFNRSNVYNSLFSIYAELGAFGTAAMLVYEDRDFGIHCETLTAGEYCVAVNESGRVDTLYREYSLSVAQVYETFVRKSSGEDDWATVSMSIKQQYDKGALDGWVEIIHAIEPNRGRDGSKLNSANKKWRSVWIEKGGESSKLLRVSGFDSFPVMCPRWDLAGADIYGTSPAMSCLGDTKQLQFMERTLGRAMDKMIDPPLQGPSSLAQSVINTAAGSYNVVDNHQVGQQGIRSIYEVSPRVIEFMQTMELTRRRIERAMYADLWRMISDIERSNVTATEINAKREEKLLMLGPVLERLHHELLNPLIDRVFAILSRIGALSPAPPELAGTEIKVQYISMLATAQNSMALGGIERISQYVGQLASVNPAVLDKIDFDQAVDAYGDALGVPPHIILSDISVADIRAARQQAQARQDQATAMQQAAMTAKDGATAANSLAGIPMGGDSVAAEMLRGMTG